MKAIKNKPLGKILGHNMRIATKGGRYVFLGMYFKFWKINTPTIALNYLMRTKKYAVTFLSKKILS